MMDSLSQSLMQNQSITSDYFLWFIGVLVVGLSILYFRNQNRFFSFIANQLNIPKRLIYLIKMFILGFLLFYVIWDPVVANIINRDYLKLIITAFAILIMFRQFQNLISGFLIFFNKNYPIGLPISYNDHVGKIDDIKLFSIVMKLDDGNSLFIPSYEFINNTILDKSNHANENRIEFTITIPEKEDHTAIEFAREAAISSIYLDYKAQNEFLLVESGTYPNSIVKFSVYALNSRYRERLKSNIIEKINTKLN